MLLELRWCLIGGLPIFACGSGRTDVDGKRRMGMSSYRMRHALRCHRLWYPSWYNLCRDMLLGGSSLWIAFHHGKILALLVFETDFPARKELRSGYNASEFRILEWAHKFPAYDVFETVVRDNVVVSAFEFDADGFLHQTAFLEFVAVH